MKPVRICDDYEAALRFRDGTLGELLRSVEGKDDSPDGSLREAKEIGDTVHYFDTQGKLMNIKKIRDLMWFERPIYEIGDDVRWSVCNHGGTVSRHIERKIGGTWFFVGDAKDDDLFLLTPEAKMEEIRMCSEREIEDALRHDKLEGMLFVLFCKALKEHNEDAWFLVGDNMVWRFRKDGITNYIVTFCLSDGSFNQLPSYNYRIRSEMASQLTDVEKALRTKMTFGEY